MPKSRRAEIHNINRKFDGFFKVDEIDVSHETYDGAMRREQRLVFERGDAVAVLLYDATSKEVIVLEQFRAPVLVARRRNDRRSSDGWIVEERIFVYFAEVAAADRTAEGGGIAGEEDIALVRLGTDELFRRLKSHQIQDPKLAIAAYWLKDYLAQSASR
jgi:hypothetical protein